MMLIQAEEDECLVRCLATPGEQEANIGAAGGWYKHYICLSVGFSSVLIVLLKWTAVSPCIWVDRCSAVLRSGFFTSFLRLAA